MRHSLLLTILVFCLLPLAAQTDYGDGHGITCATRDTAVDAYRPAPAAFLSGSAEVRTTFDLVFSDDVPAVAQAAMVFAANVWGTLLDSPVPVRVNVDWTDREDDRLLASAGPSTLFRDFRGGEPNVWYPVALAEAIAGRNLNDPDDADITVNANSTANWYFGTDGETPRGRIDLVSVMLHELGHGLGFLSSVDTINNDQLAIGFGDRVIVYDLFLETQRGMPLADPTVFGNPSAELLRAVVTNELEFIGERAVRENGGAAVPLFAPRLFDGGSSVSHLDEFTYGAGTKNALMTPFLAAGEAVHDPGPITLGIFADMGWPLNVALTATQLLPTEPLRVFPNPASDRLTVKLPSDDRARTLVLWSVTGQRLLQLPVNGISDAIVVDLAGMANGLYLAVVTGAEREYRTKVVVRR